MAQMAIKPEYQSAFALSSILAWVVYLAKMFFNYFQWLLDHGSSSEISQFYPF
jgi:hypothetical protein